MKVALLGSKDFDSLEFHISESLRFLGNDLFHIDIKDVVNLPYRVNYWAKKLIRVYDEYIFEKLAIRIIEQKPDLVICTYRFIHPKCIRKIKSCLPNTKVIQLNPDALTTFEQQQIFASPYDAYFTKDPYILAFMKHKMGLNTYYLPEAFNPRIHMAPADLDIDKVQAETNIDVVSFGTMYPYRANIISQLIDDGIDVSLYGTPDYKFPQQKITRNFRNEYITGARKAEVLLGSKIVFNNFHYAEIDSVNVKFFEIMGIGAFQICDYKPSIQEYSPIDVEKFTFKNISEAKELIHFYLANQKERREIAFQQMEHFKLHHTYDIRMKQVFDVMF